MTLAEFGMKVAEWSDGSIRVHGLLLVALILFLATGMWRD